MSSSIIKNKIIRDMISLQHIKSKYNPKEIELLRIPRLSVMPIDDKIAYGLLNFISYNLNGWNIIKIHR